jgi:hypothetical protein
MGPFAISPTAARINQPNTSVPRIKRRQTRPPGRRPRSRPTRACSRTRASKRLSSISDSSKPLPAAPIRHVLMRERARPVDPAPRWRILRHGLRDLSLADLAGPNNRATSATACRGGRSTPETAGRGGQSRRFSIAGRRFGRSGALVAVAEAARGRLEHSKTPTQPRMRNARSHSCWPRRPIDRYASQSDKPVAHTHSKTRDPACTRVRDRARVAFGM